MAAWHEVEAAILACRVSIDIAWFSRSMPSRIAVSSRSASALEIPAGAAWPSRRRRRDGHAARADGLDLEAVIAQFLGDRSEERRVGEQWRDGLCGGHC